MKRRARRKKKQRTTICLTVFVLGTMSIGAIVSIGILHRKQNTLVSPEELLVEYMSHIPEQEYEEMYAILNIEASRNISQDDFVKRNSAIYEGIEVDNMEIEVTAYDEERKAVTYQTSFDTVAGNISFENEAIFLKGEDGYKLAWDDSLIFPELGSTDKVKISTTQANRGGILDRNGRVLAGKGVASSVGIVPGKLEDRDEAIQQIAELLEIESEVIEKKLSAKWVKEDSFVSIKTIPKVAEIELMKIEQDEEVLKENERQEKLLEIPGVMISDTEVREYPLGEAAAHLVGYVQSVTAEDLENHAGEGYTANSVMGKSGMEGLFEKELKGQNGSSIYIVDSAGNKKTELASIFVQDGKDIQLTIDVKWMFRKCGFPILIFLFVVIVGTVCWEKLKTEKPQSVAEEVWEPPVEIENSEEVSVEETDTESSMESVYWFVPQSEECLITDEEKKELQSMVLSAAESVSEIYVDIVISDAPNYSSGISDFTSEQRKVVVEHLGSKGLVSVEEDTNMQNYEKIETFYAEYLDGHDSMVTVFDVHRDGLLGAVTFIYRKNKLQTYYIGVRWKEGGVPEIQGTSVSDVAEIKLTEKGYFIYAYEEVMAHAGLREYWRIKPLSDKCRELTEKYISGLSYVNYNVLVTNWDSNNVEDILMPCMYEDIYRIYTGENLKTEDWKIPGEEFEKIMTTYFPVSVDQLREHCGYDEGSNSYEYEMIYASPYPPFGEVVDYTENADGTITLIVDGVWPDYNSDLAFRNTVVVQPFEDGTFRYLSNSIEQIELELPPIARTKG